MRPCSRERQYMERLRGAAVPAASEDLTARLLASRPSGLAPWRPASRSRSPHRGSAGRSPSRPAELPPRPPASLPAGAFALAGDSRSRWPRSALHGSLGAATPPRLPADGSGAHAPPQTCPPCAREGWVCPELETWASTLRAPDATTARRHASVELPSRTASTTPPSSNSIRPWTPGCGQRAAWSVSKSARPGRPPMQTGRRGTVHAGVRPRRARPGRRRPSGPPAAHVSDLPSEGVDAGAGTGQRAAADARP